MKQLVTLSPSEQSLVAGVEDDPLPYILQNVMSALHQRDGSMYTNETTYYGLQDFVVLNCAEYGIHN